MPAAHCRQALPCRACADAFQHGVLHGFQLAHAGNVNNIGVGGNECFQTVRRRRRIVSKGMLPAAILVKPSSCAVLPAMLPSSCTVTFCAVLCNMAMRLLSCGIFAFTAAMRSSMSLLSSSAFSSLPVILPNTLTVFLPERKYAFPKL